MMHGTMNVKFVEISRYFWARWLHFHSRADHTIAEAFKMFGVICHITSPFSITENLVTFYCVLTRSKLELS